MTGKQSLVVERSLRLLQLAEAKGNRHNSIRDAVRHNFGKPVVSPTQFGTHCVPNWKVSKKRQFNLQIKCTTRLKLDTVLAVVN